jgi:hypothetical protein
LHRLDVEGVFSEFLGGTLHFCQAPCKYVLVVSEEVDELTFLFGVQTGLDLYNFRWASIINLHGLGVLGRFESTGHQEHSRAKQC